jgi:hypothetical protein
MIYTRTLHSPWGDPVEFTGTAEEHIVFQKALHARFDAYDVREQLNLLADDVESGLFGDAAMTGKFMNYIRTIKAKYSKPSNA